MKKWMLLISLGLSLSAKAQQFFSGSDYGFLYHLNVGMNGYYSTDTTAWLEIGALNTTKGFLPPRSDTNSIPKKAGSFMYEISANKFYYSDGNWWYPISGGSFSIGSAYNGLTINNTGGTDSISLGGNITRDIKWMFPNNPATTTGDTSFIEFNPYGQIHIYRNDTSNAYDAIDVTKKAGYFNNGWEFNGVNEYWLTGTETKYSSEAEGITASMWIGNNNTTNTAIVIDTTGSVYGIAPLLASNGSPYFSTASFSGAIVGINTTGAPLIIKPTIVALSLSGSASNVERGDTIYRSVRAYIEGDGYDQYEKESYGIWIDPQTFFTSLGRGATYGIAQMGSADMNYFAGHFQVGGNKPTTKITRNFYLVSDTANTSGFQFGSLTSTSPTVAANGVHLSLDASGNIILARDSSTGGGSGSFINNGTSAQTGSFNISGTGTIGGNTIVQGNILVGETTQVNSSYRIDVDGDARVNELVVNTTGADYVFDSSYHLLSLDSVGNFIGRFHHLPGVAPAGQMKQEGLKVGGNETILLQKVEELTLYVIQQNKELADLKAEVTRLKGQIRESTTGK